MRAITVRQPWAAAIVWWGKDVENRTRNIAGDYRGPVAIHAGLVEDDTAYDDDMIRQALAEQDDSWTTQEQLETGVFLGVADLVDVHPGERTGPRNQLGGTTCCSSPWAQFRHVEVRRLCDEEPQRIPVTVHLVLKNPRPLTQPVACRGQLGLWTPTADVTAAINRQLEEVHA